MADTHALIRDLRKDNGSKIVLLVGDGLGGLPLTPGGKTELETARTPNLDALAQRGTLGLSIPVLPGIAPGSGPGHLGLFGYDPLQFKIGRGVLEALGIDFALGPNDVAIRGNFCTIDAAGLITDRRAGRIGSDIGAKLCEKLDKIKIPGVEVFVKPVKEYRLVIVFRGAGLGGNVEDTDPQATGVAPLSAVARTDCSKKTADIANEFLRRIEAEARLNPGRTVNCAAHPEIARWISEQAVVLQRLRERIGSRFRIEAREGWPRDRFDVAVEAPRAVSAIPAK